MNVFRLALRMLARDLRAGELTLLGLALAVAVASLTSVSFFTDRMEQALAREANQLLGGDLLLAADRAWDPAVADAARARGLQVVASTTFTSMASGAAGAELAGVKAVESGYPLRGVLRVAPGLNQPDAEVRAGPAPGVVWLDERLTAALGVKPGDTVQLGRSRLAVGAVLTFESDRGANFFSFVPRLMLNAADLPATGLEQPGSRITYRLHFAGQAQAVAAFRDWVAPRLARGQRLEELSNARPEVRTGLDRAQRFVRLAALLAVVLAAVAVGLAARRFMQRHLDACAVMRCLGARQRQVVALYAAEFALFGAAATAAGCALGYAVQHVVANMLAALMLGDLPAPGWLPVAHGFAVGAALLAGFVAPQLLRLANVPTLRVLRREFAAIEPFTAAAYGAGAAALAGLMFWIAQDATLAGAVAGGFAASLAGFALIAAALFALVGRVVRAGAGWRYGLASLRRHGASSIVQATALGVGLTCVLLLTLTRAELLDRWRANVPPDAPNRFVINIQPDQVEAVRAALTAGGVAAPVIDPMVRGRLVQVNGRAVAPEDYTEPRAQRLVEREFNLSFMNALPPGNSVVQGRWLADGGDGFSVEQGLAETLGLKAGDVLAFEIAGARVSGAITSLRKLDWDSMRVNFFVIAPPALLQPFPASYITAFHLPAERAGAVNALVAQFPNLTVIDVAQILRQIRLMTDRLAQAVQFVFLFALAAGVLVLLAALQSTHDERSFELAMMRTLGARNRQLRAGMLTEFAVLGAVAGASAGLGAAGIGWALAHFVFKLPYLPGVETVVVGLALGVAGALAAGWIGTAGLLRKPVLPALRAMG